MNKKEFYLILGAAIAILTLADVALIHHYLSCYFINGQVYSNIGMMVYTNPNDNKTLYIPIYEKVKPK